MARNQEKAQSMLYRFREAQAAELGLGSSRTERRPRLASSVSSLKECEKWRAEVIREISRKVSKIQDFGLTDFEVRDLNDEINKLIREKGHWENQIIALGGANYKRGVPKMLDDGGSEVPGTRGYKYFGRAKDLPGVKELFSRTEEQAAQAELFRSQKYKRFQNLPPSYFGDEDETPALLAWEDQQETAEWRDGVLRVRQELQLDEQREQVPPIPRKKAVSLAEIMGTPGKRKPDDQPGAKRQKADDGQAQAHAVAVAGQDKDAPHGPSSDTYKALYYSVLDPTELDMPSVPDRKATEAFILAAKKKALRDEYIGSS